MIHFYPVHLFDNNLGTNSLDIARELGVSNYFVLSKIAKQPDEVLQCPYFKVHTIREKINNANKPTTIAYCNLFATKVVLSSIQMKEARYLLFRIMQHELD